MTLKVRFSKAGYRAKPARNRGLKEYKTPVGFGRRVLISKIKDFIFKFFCRFLSGIPSKSIKDYTVTLSKSRSDRLLKKTISSMVASLGSSKVKDIVQAQKDFSRRLIEKTGGSHGAEDIMNAFRLWFEEIKNTPEEKLLISRLLNEESKEFNNLLVLYSILALSSEVDVSDGQARFASIFNTFITRAYA